GISQIWKFLGLAECMFAKWSHPAYGANDQNHWLAIASISPCCVLNTAPVSFKAACVPLIWVKVARRVMTADQEMAGLYALEAELVTGTVDLVMPKPLLQPLEQPSPPELLRRRSVNTPARHLRARL